MAELLKFALNTHRMIAAEDHVSLAVQRPRGEDGRQTDRTVVDSTSLKRIFGVVIFSATRGRRDSTAQTLHFLFIR